MILTPKQLQLIVKSLAAELEDIGFPNNARAVFIANVVEGIYREAFGEIIPTMIEALKEVGLELQLEDDDDEDEDEDPVPRPN